MTLATRLSLFFLLFLALVLTAFSLSLYLLARGYLLADLDGKLNGTLDVLAAAAEVEPDRIEWDPVEHQVTSISHGQWTVHDDAGNIVSESPLPPGLSPAIQHQILNTSGKGNTAGKIDIEGQRIAWRRVVSAGQVRMGSLDHDEYDALTLVAVLPLGPIRTYLHLLTLALGGLSVGVWLLAVITGRRLCRRGLKPLTEMTNAAEAINAAALEQRLPDPHTGDELEALCAAFNALLGRLQESFEQQRRFTGDASHQLRTPLTVLLGQIEVALRRDRPPEEYRRLLDTIHQETRHLQQIVETLLLLARPETLEPRASFAPLDLARSLQEYLAKWDDHPRRSDIHLREIVTPLWVEADPTLLEQVLDNLIENACKYSEAGTPIMLHAEGNSAEVVLSVEDRGWGISAEELPHIFDPFFRSPQARASGKLGVGLGLAVVQRHAKWMGGEVEAEINPKGGSRFRVRLRRA